MSDFSLPYFTRLWMTLSLISRAETGQGLYWAAFRGRLDAWFSRNRPSQIDHKSARLQNLVYICHTKDFLYIAESSFLGSVKCTNLLAECLRRQDEDTFWKIADFATRTRLLACQCVLDIALAAKGQTDEVWADALLKRMIDKIRREDQSCYGFADQALKHNRPDFLMWLWSQNLIDAQDRNHIWYYASDTATRDLFDAMMGNPSAHQRLDWTRQAHDFSTPGFFFQCVKST